MYKNLLNKKSSQIITRVADAEAKKLENLKIKVSNIL
jgi:hypothetical protein